MTGQNTEIVVNAALAEALRRRNPRWNHRTLRAEQTRVVQAMPSHRPDIVPSVLGSRPVILESECDPVARVDADAKARLGKHLEDTPARSSRVSWWWCFRRACGRVPPTAFKGKPSATRRTRWTLVGIPAAGHSKAGTRATRIP